MFPLFNSSVIKVGPYFQVKLIDRLPSLLRQSRTSSQKVMLIWVIRDALPLRDITYIGDSLNI